MMPEMDEQRIRRHRRGGVRNEVWNVLAFLIATLLMIAVAVLVLSARFDVPVVGLR